MQYQNQSGVLEFYLQGISDQQQLQIPLFIVFLLLYLLTLVGNLLIVIVICLDHQLQRPMYFFLCNLSFLDMFYASITQPKLLSILLMNSHIISFTGCITQLHLFLSLAVTEFLFLTVMGYDRYVAICKPLQYPLLMNNKVCILSATVCWTFGLLEPVTHLIVISHLPFCSSNINHFYCDYTELLKISCVNTFNVEVMTYIAGIIVSLPAFSLTLASYVYIISTIMKIHSSKSRYKTFSTCVPHLTVVIIYYSTILTMHMIPSHTQTTTKEKSISLLYTILIPSSNPFIYTLRNQDVKQSFHKITRNLISMN